VIKSRFLARGLRVDFSNVNWESGGSVFCAISPDAVSMTIGYNLVGPFPPPLPLVVIVVNVVGIET